MQGSIPGTRSTNSLGAADGAADEEKQRAGLGWDRWGGWVESEQGPRKRKVGTSH